MKIGIPKAQKALLAALALSTVAFIPSQAFAQNAQAKTTPARVEASDTVLRRNAGQAMVVQEDHRNDYLKQSHSPRHGTRPVVIVHRTAPDHRYDYLRQGYRPCPPGPIPVQPGVSVGVGIGPHGQVSVGLGVVTENFALQIGGASSGARSHAIAPHGPDRRMNYTQNRPQTNPSPDID